MGTGTKASQPSPAVAGVQFQLPAEIKTKKCNRHYLHGADSCLNYTILKRTAIAPNNSNPNTKATSSLHAWIPRTAPLILQHLQQHYSQKHKLPYYKDNHHTATFLPLSCGQMRRLWKTLLVAQQTTVAVSLGGQQVHC